MYTSNMFMNHSKDIRFSQTLQENHDTCEWMEHPSNESEWTLGNVVELKTEYEKSKLTQKDIKQTFLGTDNIKDTLTFGRSKTDTFGAWLPNRSKAYLEANDYGTKLTNLRKSSGLRSHVDSLSSYTEYAYSGPIASRDGGLTQGDGKQIREDDLFSGTGKKPDELPYGGGKKDKKTDNNDKDRSEKSSFEKIIGSAAKNLGQSVISNFVSESLCAIIDSSREKGFQNTECSTILTNALSSSIQTLKYECLTESKSVLLEWLPTVVTQLKCAKGPLQHISVIWDFISMIKDLSEGRMTLWQLVKWFFSKAVCFGIRLFIAFIFGPVGCIFSTFISIALNVIKHLINRFIQSFQNNPR